MERRESENGRDSGNEAQEGASAASRRLLSRDQVLELMQAAPLALVKLIVLTYGLGARLNEAVDFQPEQINSARCEITIRSVKGPGRRVFWVDPQVIALLSAQSTPSGIDP